MEDELKKLNEGLPVILASAHTAAVICDVCQRAILLYHLRTVGRRGVELDVCSVCWWHLQNTGGITLKGMDEDGCKVTISFQSMEGSEAPVCRFYYMGQLSPNTTDRKAAMATKRLRLDEENPSSVTNRFKHSNHFALPEHNPPTEVSQAHPVAKPQPLRKQQKARATVTKTQKEDVPAPKSTPSSPVRLPPAAKPFVEEDAAPLDLPKPQQSTEHPIGAKRQRDEPQVDTPLEHPPPITPSLIDFFSSFEAKYKVAGEEAPLRTLVHVGVDDDPVVPLTRGTFPVPSLNCHVIKGRVTRCISVDVVPSASTDAEVHISVLGQHLRFQMDIWRCSYSEGCLGEPQLIHQLNVGKTEPLGC